MTRALKAILSVAVVAALSGCAIPNGVREGHAKAVTITTPSALPAPDLTKRDNPVEPDYYVGALDTLDISVFQIPDLTRTVQVDSSGRIAFPLIGRVLVQGKTSNEISDDIVHRLAKYIYAPDVTVVVRQAVSQKITVEGQVQQPGVYSIQSRTTLMQMVATAHGTTDYADEGTVIIFRTVHNEKVAARFDLNKIRGGNMSDPEVFGNDVVAVTRSGPKTEWHYVLQALVVPTFFIRYVF